MLLADVPWMPYSETDSKRWLRQADIMKPDGIVLRIWEGHKNGLTDYAMYPYFGNGTEAGRREEYKRERRLELDALEAQCLLFHYLGDNDG